MSKVELRDEDGYASCPRCGYPHVARGYGYDHREHTATVNTNCYRCDFGFETKLNFVAGESAKELDDERCRQKEAWNDLSDKQRFEGAEKGFALYRVADEMRRTGERIIKRAKAIEKEAESLVGRHRDFGRIDIEEDKHGTE